MNLSSFTNIFIQANFTKPQFNYLLLLDSHLKLGLHFIKDLDHKHLFLILHLNLFLHHKNLGQDVIVQKELEEVYIRVNVRSVISKVTVLLAIGSGLILVISLMCFLKHIMVKSLLEIKLFLMCLLLSYLNHHSL